MHDKGRGAVCKDVVTTQYADQVSGSYNFEEKFMQA